MEQVVWALDLRLHYSDILAMFQLACFVTRGQFNSRDHTFTVSPLPTRRKLRRRRLAGTEEEVLSACAVLTEI